jgi:hypothetical protein
MLHEFKVVIEADTPRTAAEMCKTASEALHAGTLRLQEERVKGNVRYEWIPGLAALGNSVETDYSRLTQVIPSLYDALRRPGVRVVVPEISFLPVSVIYLDVIDTDGTTARYAISANNAILQRTTQKEQK